MMSHRNELYSTLCGYLGALSFGYTIGYSSPALPQMTASERIMHNNEDAASWFVSIATLGAMFGCLIAGSLVERWGRRLTLLITAIPYFVGWLSIIIASEIQLLCFGRFLTGIGCGAVCVAAPVYIAEMASRDLRGRLGAGVQLSVTIGIFLVYCLGVVLDWRVLATVGAVIPLIAAIVTLQLPESPRFLLSKHRNTEAINALIWLRGASAVAENECREIEKNLAESSEQVSLLELASRQEFSRPLVVVLAVMAFQQATGINVVMFYTVSIFQAAGFKESGGVATVVIGAVQVIATIAACTLMDSKGRRKMLIVAGLGMAVACFTLGTYYRSVNTGTSLGSSPVVSNLSWLALVSLIAYMIAFSLGWGPVPMLLMSEVFPGRARGTASAICVLTNFLMAFVVTKWFSWLQATVGLDGTFWLFGMACIGAIIFVIYFVPETKGRSLEDIERYFLGQDLIRGV
jgi:SP family facilitated glucose transporter-like MFS transporter 8